MPELYLLSHLLWKHPFNFLPHQVSFHALAGFNLILSLVAFVFLLVRLFHFGSSSKTRPWVCVGCMCVCEQFPSRGISCVSTGAIIACLPWPLKQIIFSFVCQVKFVATFGPREIIWKYRCLVRPPAYCAHNLHFALIRNLLMVAISLPSSRNRFFVVLAAPCMVPKISAFVICLGITQMAREG